jgi:uncharacterized membrane protein
MIQRTRGSVKILKSILCGFVCVIGACAVFAAIVWLYSGFKSGFLSGIQYDARAIVDLFPFVSVPVVVVVFILGFLWQYRRPAKRMSPP